MSGNPLTLLTSNGENAKALSGSWQAMFDGWMEWQQEAIRFGQERFRENLDRNMALMSCQSVSEAFQIHCDFAHTANKQYLEEGARLFTMAGRIGEHSCAPLEQRTKQTLEDLAGS
jgi:hypothetical protein